MCLIAKKLNVKTKKLTSLQESMEKHIVGATTQPSVMCSLEADLTNGKQTYQLERDVVPGDRVATHYQGTLLRRRSRMQILSNVLHVRLCSQAQVMVLRSRVK